MFFFNLRLVIFTIMDKKLFNKALDALNEFMNAQNAHIYDAPTPDCLSIDEEYVYLGNSNNSFGKYEITTGKFTPDRKE